MHMLQCSSSKDDLPTSCGNIVFPRLIGLGLQLHYMAACRLVHLVQTMYDVALDAYTEMPNQPERHRQDSRKQLVTLRSAVITC